MTINPETGLPEAGWFRDLLGFAAPFLVSMIPGVGPVLGGMMGGGIGSLIKGGDFKDVLLGAGMGALGGKVFGSMGEAGNIENLLADPATFDAAGVGVDALTKAGLDPNLLAQGTQGMDPMTFLETTGKGASARQLGVFKESFAPKFDWETATVPQKWGALKGGGLGGVKDALFTPAGLGLIGGTGLIAQHESQQAYEDYLLAMEEHRKQRARDIEAYYPENFPIDALAASGGAVGGYAGGGSIYKNRYINGNWS